MRKLIITGCLLALVVCCSISASAAATSPFPPGVEWHGFTIDEYYSHSNASLYFNYDVYELPLNPIWHFSGPGQSRNYGELDWVNSNVTTNIVRNLHYYPLGDLAINTDIFPRNGDGSFKTVQLQIPFEISAAVSPDYTPMESEMRAGIFVYDSSGIVIDFIYTDDVGYILDTMHWDYDQDFNFSLSLPSNAAYLQPVVYGYFNSVGIVRIRANAKYEEPAKVKIASFTNMASHANVLDPLNTGTIAVDGNLQLVTFSLAQDYFYWSYNSPYGPSVTGLKFDYTVPVTRLDKVYVYGFPLGDYGFLKCNDYAVGESLHIDYNVSFRVDCETPTYYQATPRLYLMLFDVNFVPIPTDTLYTVASDTWHSAQTGQDYTFNVSADVPVSVLGDAVYFRFVYEHEIYNDGFGFDPYTSFYMRGDAFKASVTIPLDYLSSMANQGIITNMRLNQVETAIKEGNHLIQNTNQALDKLHGDISTSNQHLEDLNINIQESNDKLDNIINGEVNPIVPDGADLVLGLENQESAIRDQVSVHIGEAENYQVSALDSLFLYASSFAAISLVFDAFGSMPFFSALLYVSLAVGIFCVLVGLTLDAVGGFKDAEKRDQKTLRKQINKGRKKK